MAKVKIGFMVYGTVCFNVVRIPTVLNMPIMEVEVSPFVRNGTITPPSEIGL